MVECKDKKCPVHGKLSTRGKTFQAKVISSKADRTAIVGWGRIAKIKKYQRYIKKRTSVAAHNPACINAKAGDNVTIAECRPLSKTKRFVIIKKGELKEKV